MPVPPTFPVPHLAIRPWPDPVIDQLGHDARSSYVERFWLGLLGPTATWFLRRIAAGFDAAPEGFQLDVAATAVELGLGARSGKHSPFLRAIDRCCRFGQAELDGSTALRVRRKLAPLNRVQIERLPATLRAEHQLWVDRPLPGSALAYEELRVRSRQMALSLLELGEDGEATERQLARWRVHPAMAHDATRWAQARYAERQAATELRGTGTEGGRPGPPDAA